MIPIMLFSLSFTAPEARKPQSIRDVEAEMERLADVARNEGPIPLDQFGRNPTARAFSESQNFAEQERYGEAAQRLRQLLAGTPLGGDWKQMAEARIEILDKWAQADRVDLPNFSRFYLDTGPHWFHQRTFAVIRLWNMQDVPIIEKYVLLSRFFEKKGENNSEALAHAGLVLEAIPDLPGVTDAVAVDALLRAAAIRHRLNDLDRAEKDWDRAMQGHENVAGWATAVLNLGRLHEKKGAKTEAAELFKLLLDTRPDAKDFRHANAQHDAALELSRHYERRGDCDRALEYTEKARTEYPFVSGCGTCMDGERDRLEQRIAGLKYRSVVATSSEAIGARWWIGILTMSVFAVWYFWRRGRALRTTT